MRILLAGAYTQASGFTNKPRTVGSLLIIVAMKKQNDLIEFLFDGQTNWLSAELLQWVNISSRFSDFVETYRDKIRKKLRVTRDPEGTLDVRGELQVAYRLLQDRRLILEYEPYTSTQKRGADFAVVYRSNQRFNIEVSRMRAEETSARRAGERTLRIILSKFGQMQPGTANLLVIHAHKEIAQALSLEKLMQEIKTRVEGRERSFYELSRYANPAAFYKDFLHLSGILLWADEPQLWSNKQARPELDSKILRLVYELAGDNVSSKS